MWLRKRKGPKHEGPQLKPKKWEYVRFRLELGTVRHDCIKKASWTVPLGRRINPF